MNETYFSCFPGSQFSFEKWSLETIVEGFILNALGHQSHPRAALLAS